MNNIIDNECNHTPMMQQYLRIKRNYLDMFVFYRMGDFYELFYNDAVEVSKLINITLTTRGKSTDNPIPMAGIPFHASDQYFAKLIKIGKSLVVVDQVGVNENGTMDRKVSRVLTPGTLSDDLLLDQNKENFIIALYNIKESTSIAILSITSGKFYLNIIDNSQVYNFVDKYSPSEILIAESCKDAYVDLFKNISFKLIPDWEFELQKNLQRLVTHFNTKDLLGFGVKSNHHGICSAGVVLDYCKKMTNNDLYHINKIAIFSESDYLILDSISRRNLEINSTLSGESYPTLFSLINQCDTPMGSRLLRSWLSNPLIKQTDISDRHDSIECFIKNNVSISNLLIKFCDIERISARISLLTAKPRDLSALKESLQILPLLLDSLQNINNLTLIEQCVNNIKSFPETLLAKLLIAIKDEPELTLRDGNVIKDGFNEELDRLRDLTRNGNALLVDYEEQQKKISQINNLKVEYNKINGFYIEVSKGNVSKVPDYYYKTQTLKNCERFTTTELKKIEHDFLTSSSRAIELEKELYLDILIFLKSYISNLQNLSLTISTLDVINNYKTIAKKYNYSRPKLTNESIIKIDKGRHPVIENQVAEFIPNNVLLDDNNKFLIITGPNMGGKSTYMRQVALIVLMASIGSYVPAEYCLIGKIDRIYTRIGASDDISKGKSTFMVEMTETANILNNATANSLILIDEVGRGTSTFDGLALANAISRYLIEKICSYTLFATHYFEITELEKRLS